MNPVEIMMFIGSFRTDESLLIIFRCYFFIFLFIKQLNLLSARCMGLYITILYVRNYIGNNYSSELKTHN